MRENMCEELIVDLDNVASRDSSQEIFKLLRRVFVVKSVN